MCKCILFFEIKKFNWLSIVFFTGKLAERVRSRLILTVWVIQPLIIACIIYYIENVKIVSIVLCVASFVVIMRLAFKLSNLETFGNPIEL